MTHNNSNSLQNASQRTERLTLQEYRSLLDEIALTIKSGSLKLQDIESAAITPLRF